MRTYAQPLIDFPVNMRSCMFAAAGPCCLLMQQQYEAVLRGVLVGNMVESCVKIIAAAYHRNDITCKRARATRRPVHSLVVTVAEHRPAA